VRLLAAILLLVAGSWAAHAQPAAKVDWSKAQVVNVMLVDDMFVPDHLTFRHGVAYRLHLENHGKELHEFTAPEFFADTIVRDPAGLANGGIEVVVQSGATADVYLMPLHAGTFHLTCADHDWDGMVGEIVVQ
jgi:uncharacterized cupredoxin-like copper-binding protein